MAWLFSLSAECATKAAAEAVAGHFRGMTVVLRDGSQFPCGGGVWGDEKTGWWAVILPDGVSRRHVGPAVPDS